MDEVKNSNQPGSVEPNSVYVLIDDANDVAQFGGPSEIDADKLGDHLKRFSDGISQALDHCKTLAGEFDLTEISIEAKLTAEFGFVLVSKAGVEGSVTMKFSRRK